MPEVYASIPLDIREEERRDTYTISDAFLSGLVLEELKNQSTSSCLLCDLDEIEDDEWE